MNRWARFHCGHDCTGRRHWRLKPYAAALRCRRQHTLLPEVVWTASLGRERWRNGWHRRNWMTLAVLVRADRRSFLCTLTRPPLLPQTTLD